MQLHKAPLMSIEAINPPSEIPDLRKKTAKEELDRVMGSLTAEGIVRTCHLARIKPERTHENDRPHTLILDVTFVGPAAGKRLPVSELLHELTEEYALDQAAIHQDGAYAVIDASEESVHPSSATNKPEIRSVYYIIAADDGFEEVDRMLTNPALQTPDQTKAQSPFAFHLMQELDLIG